VAKEYAWNYRTPEDPGDELFLIAKLRGTAAALSQFDALKAHDSSKANEGILNGLGYRLLYGGKESDAVMVFSKNVQEYPQSANVYDSLGEAYMKTGQKDLAIQNYEKSLQLNPKNDNAVEQLKTLKGEAMNPKLLQQDGFTVMGISARTSNAKEMTADGVIGKQWMHCCRMA
jgi:predicted Zn-dependent protease